MHAAHYSGHFNELYNIWIIIIFYLLWLPTYVNFHFGKKYLFYLPLIWAVRDQASNFILKILLTSAGMNAL